jgi:hypothetical protein
MGCTGRARRRGRRCHRRPAAPRPRPAGLAPGRRCAQRGRAAAPPRAAAPAPAIDAPCKQCLRHGDPIHTQGKDSLCHEAAAPCTRAGAAPCPPPSRCPCPCPCSAAPAGAPRTARARRTCVSCADVAPSTAGPSRRRRQRASPNGCIIEVPWLMNGGHGASLRQPFRWPVAPGRCFLCASTRSRRDFERARNRADSRGVLEVLRLPCNPCA